MPREFLTPPNVPEDNSCRSLQIPNDKLWLGIFNSALLDTTYAYNYTQVNDTDLTPEETAAICQQIVWDYFDSICGEGDPCVIPGTELPPFRIGANGRIQQNVDGTWSEPEGDYTLPEPEARTNPSEVDRICLAAANAANALEETYEQMLDAYNISVDPALGAISWAGATGTTILAALGIVSGGLVLVAYGVFTLFYEAFQWLTSDVWDNDFTDELVCILIDNASDDAGVVTFDYDAVYNAISRSIELTPDLNELRLWTQITYMLQFIGEQGLNLAGATTSITTPDCSSCEETWCAYFDFRIDDGGFVSPDFGTWVSGTGWQSTAALSGAYYRATNVYIDLGADYTITYFKARFSVVWGGIQGVPTDARNITLRLNSTVPNDPARIFAPAQNDVLLYEGELTDVDRLYFLGTTAYDNVNPRTDLGGELTLRSIEIHGLGEHPFPEYSC